MWVTPSCHYVLGWSFSLKRDPSVSCPADMSLASIHRANWKKGESQTDLQWVLWFAAHLHPCLQSHLRALMPEPLGDPVVPISLLGHLPLSLSTFPSHHLSSCLPAFKFFLLLSSLFFLVLYVYPIVLMLVGHQEGAVQHACVCRVSQSQHTLRSSEMYLFARQQLYQEVSKENTVALPSHFCRNPKSQLSWRITLMLLLFISMRFHTEVPGILIIKFASVMDWFLIYNMVL